MDLIYEDEFLFNRIKFENLIVNTFSFLLFKWDIPGLSLLLFGIELRTFARLLDYGTNPLLVQAGHASLWR